MRGAGRWLLLLPAAARCSWHVAAQMPAFPSPPSFHSRSLLAANSSSSSEPLWTLRDNLPNPTKCQTACVMTSTVTLNWCASHVTHLRFCDFTATKDVVSLEQAAVNAFMAMENSLKVPPGALCKRAMRRWMCWQFFPQCGGTSTKAGVQPPLLPVCRASCLGLAAECSVGWLDCAVELEELLGSAPPWWFDAAGVYIRGVKPRNASVPLASRRSVAPQDGVTGLGAAYGDRPTCTGAAHRAAPPWLLLLAALGGVLHLQRGAVRYMTRF